MALFLFSLLQLKGGLSVTFRGCGVVLVKKKKKNAFVERVQSPLNRWSTICLWRRARDRTCM